MLCMLLRRHLRQGLSISTVSAMQGIPPMQQQTNDMLPLIPFLYSNLDCAGVAESGQVAIFDATNTTEERRQLLVRALQYQLNGLTHT